MSHSTKSGVAHFASDDEDACLEDARYLLSFLPQKNLETPPRVLPTDDRCARTPSSTTSSPTPEQAVRHARGDPPGRRRWGVLRGARALRREHRLRVRAARRPRRRRRRQPAGLARGRARHRLVVQGGAASCARATRSTSRSSRSSTSPASCPAPRRSGAGSSATARSCLRLRRGDRAEDHVITRKAYGGAYDVMASKHMLRRLQLRLADGGGRGDGARGRGEHHLPPRHRLLADAGRRARRS